MLEKLNQENTIRKGGRVVEGARLESVYVGNRIEGSNPFLSAKKLKSLLKKGLIDPFFVD
jgi:hypothetical protein